jgi:hypothetical protein
MVTLSFNIVESYGKLGFQMSKDSYILKGTDLTLTGKLNDSLSCV